jgi:hypothetical protein
MFNLTVDEAHTFFVGEQDWLVHNCEYDELDQRALSTWGSEGGSILPNNDLPPGLGGSSLPLTRQQLSNAGTVPRKNGLTEVGRSLQKHGGRSGIGSDWDLLTRHVTGTGIPTRASDLNTSGQQILDHMINHQASVWSIGRSKGRITSTIDVHLPTTSPGGALGARWDFSGNFIGFLDH